MSESDIFYKIEFWERQDDNGFRFLTTHSVSNTIEGCLKGGSHSLIPISDAVDHAEKQIRDSRRSTIHQPAILVQIFGARRGKCDVLKRGVAEEGSDQIKWEEDES